VAEQERGELREVAKALLEIYGGEPHHKDRLYDLFVTYTYDGSRYSVRCPLCNWSSEPLDAGSRLEYFSSIARVLASHAYGKHAWTLKYKRYRRAIGARIVAETRYKCLRCGVVLPNFLTTVLHEIVAHSWRTPRAGEGRWLSRSAR